MQAEQLNILGISICIKDLDSRVLFCNESFAKAAGVDSPQEAIGKRDEDLIWHDCATLYRQGDIDVLKGKTFLNRIEPQFHKNGSQSTIVTSKSITRDTSGHASGVMVSFIELKSFPAKQLETAPAQKIEFYLSTEKQCLSKQQVLVLKQLLLGKTSLSIAKTLALSVRTVEDYISALKSKFYCRTREELIELVWKNGLTFLIMSHQ